MSNVGFFYTGFTPNICDHFHLVAPALQGTGSVPYAASVLLADQSDSGPNNGVAGNSGYSVSPGFTAFVSSLMSSSRTYNISQRKPWVGLTLLSVYVMASGVRFLSSEAMHPVLIPVHSSNGFQVCFLGFVSQEGIYVGTITILTLCHQAVMINVSAALSVLANAD